MEPTTFTQRLNIALKHADGVSQSDIARECGISTASVSNWLTGISKSMRGENLLKVSRALGVSPVWLANGEGDMRAGVEGSSIVALPPDEVHIPQWDTGGKMGAGGLVLDGQPGIIRSWRVSNEWAHQNIHRVTSLKNLVIVTGFGDSMKPLYNPGDPLLVDTGRREVNVDGVYFFRIDTNGFIKRLQRIPTQSGLIIRAKSENPAYEPFDIVDGMDFEVFGWVVKAWRGEDF